MVNLEESWGTITGVVKDSATGVGLQDAVVKTYPVSYVTTTDSGGNCSLKVKPGGYKVIASKTNYISLGCAWIQVDSGQEITYPPLSLTPGNDDGIIDACNPCAVDVWCSATSQTVALDDSDCDGIADDGDCSAILGDTPCTEGNTEGCDDICPNDPENDIDNDGICGDVDNCPTIPNGPSLGTCTIIGTPCTASSQCGCIGVCNINQEDSDGDGWGDVCDNCRYKCNVDQWDADSGGKGDVCDSEPGCGKCAESECETEC